jgi:dienelactone hydrolase
MLRAFVLVVSCLASAVAADSEAAQFPRTPGRHTIQFSKSATQSGADEVKWRLHAAENPKPFDITKERFQLIIPKNYRADEAWGLFIWISASHSPEIPAPWEEVLAARKLLFVGARQSGNPRDVFDRMRMAVDASVRMRQQVRVDGRRVYVSGFSGGARVASMLGVAFADIFTGTLAFMGVNFYSDLRGEDGKTYGVSYIPDDEVLAIAKKQCRYVLVTSEKDFNRANTRAAHGQGFQREGFASAHIIEVPGIGHAMPDAKWLGEGIDYLDGRKSAQTK